MMRFQGFVVCCVLLLAWPLAAHAVDVQATLDRSTVQLGETVTLNVRVESAASADAPDFSALDRDFDVLGSSQNRSVSIVNGVRRAEVTFGVALRPRREGTLEIPALAVAGTFTDALQLQVTAAGTSGGGATAAPGQDVFLEVQVDPAHAYVGQQLSYVARLYYAVNLGGSLQTPQIDGVQTAQVGDDLKYTAQRGGRSWNVLERRFALTPQHAGTLQIPALSFQGETSDANDLNSFFGGSTPVSARSPALSVKVQAVPAAAGTGTWLPARQLTLTLDGVPDAQTSVRVGQALNLTMTLQASGLAADALPALSLPSLDGATVYPDKPVTTTGNDGPWLLGREQRKFALVPERAGTLTIPATSLKWWNVLADQLEVAQIPARTLTVLPALGVATALPAQPAVAAVAQKSQAPQPARGAREVPWRWLALGSISLWLCSVLLWWYWRRRRAAPGRRVLVAGAGDASARECQRAFLAAARGDDVAAQTRTLLTWARAERPSIQHLGELAAALADAGQRAAIVDLQRRRYAGAPLPVSSASLADVFQRGLVWRQNGPSTADPGVPPLYPFNVHPD